MAQYLSWELKIWRRLKKKPVPFLLIILGLALFFFGAYNYQRARILSFTAAPSPIANEDSSHYPNELIIPSLNLDLKVDAGLINKGIWQISPANATFLASSAVPGSGNTVIYGHNKKVILGSLPYISIGQEIKLKTNNGNIFNYKVITKEWVNPDRVDLVSPSINNELTLYTCAGFADTKRVVVKAIPVN